MTNKYYVSLERELDINLAALSPKQKQDIKKIFPQILANEKTIFKKETLDLFDSINDYNKNKEGKQILTFFENKIPKYDLEALNASLYLRSVFRKRKDIKKLKQDINTTFGTRGNNISNLCTAGYFDNFLMELYNSSPGTFNGLYEDIVSNKALAVFVNEHMTKEKITEDIKNKLDVSKKYGIKFVHIHGIGTSTVKKINEYIENKEKKDFDTFHPKKILKEENIIIVELILK